MRARLTAALVAAVTAVSLHTQAATTVTVTAVNVRGEAIVWSTPRNTFYLKAGAASPLLKVKLTCLKIEGFKSSVGLGPVVVPLIGTQVNASVKAGGVTYYVLFQSFAQNGNKARQTVTVMGVSKKAVPTNACASNPNMTSAAGLAIYG